MAESKATKMFKKYPMIFMAMYMHSLKENPLHPDDNGVIYSKIMANVANPGTYWMPATVTEEILKDFESTKPKTKK